MGAGQMDQWLSGIRRCLENEDNSSAHLKRPICVAERLIEPVDNAVARALGPGVDFVGTAQYPAGSYSASAALPPNAGFSRSATRIAPVRRFPMLLQRIFELAKISAPLSPCSGSPHGHVLIFAK